MVAMSFLCLFTQPVHFFDFKSILSNGSLFRLLAGLYTDKKKFLLQKAVLVTKSLMKCF